MLKKYDEEILKKLQNTELSIFKDIVSVCQKHNIGYFMLFGTLIGAIRHKGFIPWDDDMDIGMLREDYDSFVKVFEKELGDKYTLTTPLRTKDFSSTVVKVQKKGTKFIPEYSKKMKCEQGIFIDIFIYDKVSANEKQYKKQVKKTRTLSRLIFLAGSPNPEINIGGIAGRAAALLCKAGHYVFKLIPNIHVYMYKKYVKYSVMANVENSCRYTTFQSTAPDKCIVNIDDLLPYEQVAFENYTANVPKNYDYILTERYGDYMKLPPEEERVNHAADVIDFGDE